MTLAHIKRIVAAIAVLAMGTAAYAVPILGTIEAANNWSLVHNGSNPAGIDDPADWMRFDSGQTISLDLTAGILTLVGGATTYSLSSDNGATGSIEISALSMNLNAPDGFLSGTLEYSYNGNGGSFVFADQNYGSSPFNSSVFDGASLQLFAWGGDDQNNIGIDLGLGGSTVPEPGTLMLLMLGITGFAAARRRSR